MDKFQESELTPEEMVLAGVVEENELDEIELEGGELGRGGWLRNAKAFANHKRSMRASGIGRHTSASRFRRQALERINKMSKTVQQKLMTGTAQMSDMVYYSCAEVSGGSCDLIDEAVNRKRGVTNLDAGKIDKDKEFVLSALQLVYDSGSQDGAYADPIPASIINGEWELQLEGKKVFDNMPVSVFTNGVNGYDVNKPYGLYILNNPKHIKPQTTIEFEVKDANGTAKGFLKVYLIGTSVKPY